MARRQFPPLDPAALPEPGPELNERIALIEQRVRAQLASARQPAGGAASAIDGSDVLLLIACVRDLLRDRDALLEEIDALECGAGRPRVP